MIDKMRDMFRDEEGVTALETAIILIAFVVVAAVFAFTVLSAGTFTTERSKEAVYAGLSEVRGSLELRGSVIVTTSSAYAGTNGYGEYVIFTVSNVAGGEPVDFTEPTTSTQSVVVIEYRDSAQRREIANWTVAWPGYDDGDGILEERELVEIRVPLTGNINPNLGTNETFVVEVKPPSGAVLGVQRTMPESVDIVNHLR
jgi:flagellin FlaB